MRLILASLEKCVGCPSVPGPLVGAWGLVGWQGKWPLNRFLPVYRGGACFSCDITRLSTLGKTLPSPSLSFPSYKWGGRDIG